MGSITGLGGEIVAFTYPALLKVSDNDILPSTTGGGRTQPAVFCNSNRTAAPNAIAIMSDGIGQTSSLSIGLQNAGASISGPTIINGEDKTNIAHDRLLDVQNGGVRIEEKLVVGATTDACTNNICGTTQLRVANFDCLATFCSNALVCGGLTVNGSTVLSNTTINGTLLVTGSITSNNDITAFSTSDKRLKNNIIKINNSNDVINNLNGYTYDWDEKSGKTGEGVGVIAQEVKELIPSAVRENQDGYLSVDYIKLIPYLIEEVKGLNNRIKTLENK
tara:strand:+ start:11509 stop:12339 length:831 start_codon:yes stop_codon:yes gene_type:complete